MKSLQLVLRASLFFLLCVFGAASLLIRAWDLQVAGDEVAAVWAFSLCVCCILVGCRIPEDAAEELMSVEAGRQEGGDLA